MRRGGRKRRRSQKHRGRRRVARTSTAGAKLPEELFEVILWYATRYYDHAPAPSLDVPDKHAMSSFALVSKYFAKCCRPDSWRKVSLSSAKALRRLLDLLDGGHKWLGCSVLAFTRKIYVRPGEDDPPWTHQVGMVLFARMQQLGENNFPKVSLSAHNSHDIPNGPASLLPRTLPSSIFRHVHSFSLVQTRFSRGKTILRCFSSMRHLTNLTLENATCDTIPDQRDIVRLSSSATWKLVHISEPKTTDNITITVLQAMFMACFGSHIPLPHQQSECTCITGLLAQLWQLWHAEWSNSKTMIAGSAANPSGFEFIVGGVTIVIKSPPPLTRSTPSPAVNSALFDCVIRVNQDCASTTRLDQWSAVAADFGNLRYLGTLGLHSFNLNDMEIVFKNLHPLLRHQHNSGRTLEFCITKEVYDKKGGCFQYPVLSTWDINETFAKFGLALGDPADQEENADVPGATGDNGADAGEMGGETDANIANDANAGGGETDGGDTHGADGSIPGRNSGQTEDAAALEGTAGSDQTSTGKNESQPASTVLEGSSTERVLVEATGTL